MAQLPNDPIMLYSVLNTKLRDQYDSLETLCDDLNVDEKEIREKLAGAGFKYDSDLNQFV
ncbi:MAG: DUF4250 domain-containing protein [Eubacterium sp.]|nr:DUF4250 domain-containing protein [Eubacterium sp.]